MLDALPKETELAVGNSPAAFERAAADADVIFNWSRRARFAARGVSPWRRSVRWVHSRSAGLDNLLFPELVESPVPLTNGSGVFSQSLGEFALAAILYFAKDFRRMIRNQMAGPMGAVRRSRDRRPDRRDCGLWRYRPRRGGTRACDGHARGRAEAASRHTDPLVDRIYTPAERCEMIARCDYVVVAAPLTEETRGMIGEAEFAAMKPAGVMINVGRGPVIDEAGHAEGAHGGPHQGRGAGCFHARAAARRASVLQDGKCAALAALRGPHDGLAGAGHAVLPRRTSSGISKGEPLRNVVDKKLGY